MSQEANLAAAEEALKNESGQYDTIYIKGARSNNLQNVNLSIPKNQLVVVTGVSGSGKSSLTMDTLFAEGQRRYVESLSSYARQFLMRMKKPEVDYIKGICPAIAIEQKVSTRSPRSTVGTLTEVYDFLRLLFARAGKTYSPISGDEVKRHTITDVSRYIHTLEKGTQLQLLAQLPEKYKDRTVDKELRLLLQKGYTRVFVNGQLADIEQLITDNPDFLKERIDKLEGHDIKILIDRFVVDIDNEDNRYRIDDSIQTAFYESEGSCTILLPDGSTKFFNNRFELDGTQFPDTTPQLFNFNNPFGACPQCEGFSKVMGIDEAKVVPDQTRSVFEGAVACWKGQKYGKWQEALLAQAHHFGFPVHTPWKELTKQERRLVWTGNQYFRGINAFFEELEEKMYKIQNRVMLARYRGRTTCPACEGGRLRKEAFYVKIQGKDIGDLVDMPIDELIVFFDSLKLDKHTRKIAERLLLEVTNRLRFMSDLGLDYLTLNRLSSTLSGGETQRINLTRTLGSNLSESMYILDEPSIGLHPRDTNRLVQTLKRLRDLGNTVVVVEHEEDVIRNADFLVDVGPKAGINGGKIVYAGPYKDILKKAKNSLTTKYLTGEMEVALPEKRREAKHFIEINGASQNNLNKIDVKIPIGTMTVVTGVSGSGKTTLVKQILYPAMNRHLGIHNKQSVGAHIALDGDLDKIDHIEMIDQRPIGKSSRSNPVTYVKAYDSIRALMASRQLSKIRGYKPGYFSFNVDGGRCPSCKGEGEQVVEMQFLADVRLTCEECNGHRFKKEILDVKYKDKNISEILDMSIDEALGFFEDYKDIHHKLQSLSDVGLGYVKLGQSSSTLSGGEAQRVKLASFLTKDNRKEKILFIFDEPTTGLHFHDIVQLLKALNALVEHGHTVVVVEHNMEVIKSADWVIDLGPGGGKHGGDLIYQGVPEGLVDVEVSYTGAYLKEKIT